MNVPANVLQSLSFVKIFPPANQSTNWDRLYVEFQDCVTADLINRYAVNLKPGKTVSIYVPHGLYPRFNSIRDIAHTYRHGEIKHKTKIKINI